MIWVAIAAMTGASIFAILRALSQVGHTGSDNSPDIALFRGQLAMIADEALRGDLTANEAEASRAEISRRLLAVTRRQQKQADGLFRSSSLLRRRAAASLALVVLPVFSLTFYVISGQPRLAGKPMQLTSGAELENQNVERLIQRVEQQLAQHPESVEGWDLLARVQAQRGRPDLAAEALGQAIIRGGATIDRLVALSEAQIALSGGIVTGEARLTLERAASVAPHDARVDFFLALGLRQDGRHDAAIVKLGSALAKSSSDAPWLPLVRDQLARLLLDDLGADVPQSLNPADVISALRLSISAGATTPGHDLVAWRRRLLAHMVLNGIDGLDSLVQEGRTALADNRAALAEFDAFVAQLMYRS